MKTKVLEQLLFKAGDFELEISKEKEDDILDMIYNYERPRFKILSFPLLIRLGFSLIILLLIGMIYNNYLSYENPDILYKKVMKQIITVTIQRDVEKALSLYDEEFFNQHKRNEIKKNILWLFKNYKIKYKPEKKNIIVSKNNALIENKIEYRAEPDKKNLSPISYIGYERIYLKKRGNEWKIITWIYEK